MLNKFDVLLKKKKKKFQNSNIVFFQSLTTVLNFLKSLHFGSKKGLAVLQPSSSHQNFVENATFIILNYQTSLSIPYQNDILGYSNNSTNSL